MEPGCFEIKAYIASASSKLFKYFNDNRSSKDFFYKLRLIVVGNARRGILEVLWEEDDEGGDF